jgi:putative transposase
MTTRTPFELNEFYHCYNRGTDKRLIFQSIADKKRFLSLLYVCNGTNSIRLSELYDPKLDAILANKHIDLGDPLVGIGAYSLMPNHVHFIFQEIREGGIAKFMQKVFTGYTMYFNKKHDRTGALFSGTFKSKHISDDDYLKRCIAYVLLNQAELFDKGWKEGRTNLKQMHKKLLAHPFSSLQDFFDVERPEKKIINVNFSDFYDKKPSFYEMLTDAQEFYSEQPPEV